MNPWPVIERLSSAADERRSVTRGRQRSRDDLEVVVNGLSLRGWVADSLSCIGRVGGTGDVHLFLFRNYCTSKAYREPPVQDVHLCAQIRGPQRWPGAFLAPTTALVRGPARLVCVHSAEIASLTGHSISRVGHTLSVYLQRESKVARSAEVKWGSLAAREAIENKRFDASDWGAGCGRLLFPRPHPFFSFQPVPERWSERQDSNLRPPDPQGDGGRWNHWPTCTYSGFFRVCRFKDLESQLDGFGTLTGGARPIFGGTEMADDGGRTVWASMVDEAWEPQRLKIDWMAAHGMHHHVAALMGGDWPDVIRDELNRVARAQGRTGVRMLSIGCGDARIESAGLERDWPVDELLCAERDPILLSAAAANLGRFEHVAMRTLQFDMDQPPGPVGAFDVVFFCHSIHHTSNPEALLAYVNAALAPGGVIMGMDYFGAARCQPDSDVLEMLNETYSNLPSRLKLDLLTGLTHERIRVETPAEVAAHDPSEAPRSADIRSLLFSLFPVIDKRPMGGTLLRPLLNHRAGNFVTEGDRLLLGALQQMERLAIRARAIPSDDLYFVVGKSERI